MKKEISIISVSVLTGLQILLAHPPSTDSIDVIVAFSTSAAAATMKTQLKATEWGYSKPSEARLVLNWMLLKKFGVRICVLT